MASSVADEYKIPKLNGDNYFVWSIRAKAALVSKKLWNAVVPGYVDETGNDLKSLNSTQQGTNDSALAFLILIVSDEFIEDLGSCTLAKEAWTVLEIMHTKFSLYHTTTLVLEYVNFRKEDCMTMQEYLSAKGEMARKIQSGGIEFTDKQKAAFYLTGLPFPKYEGFVRSIEREGDSSVLSTVGIKAKLLLEEKRMKREDEVKDKMGECRALAVHENTSPHKHEARHTSYEPTYKQRNVRYSDKGNQSKNIVCFACNETGHISKYCPRFMKRELWSPTNQIEHSSEQRKGSTAAVNYMALKVVHGNCRASRRKPNESRLSQWFVDSAASHHMTPHKELFQNFEKITGSVSQADDSPLKVEGCGTVEVKLLDAHGGWTLNFTEVLYVPGISDNLLSGRQLDKKGLTLVIQNGSVHALNKVGQRIFTAFAEEGGNEMYVIEGVNPTINTKKAAGTVKKTETMLWHRRFGHMQKLPSGVTKTETKESCDVCIRGKMKRLPFPTSENRAENVLDLIHSDVVCQIQPESIGGAKNFVTFTDDHSRYTEAVPIKKKSDAFVKFRDFKCRSELLHERKIKALQTDGGGEYCGNEFDSYLKEMGIQHRVSTPYTPQQNGRSERVNQTLMNIVRSLLIESGLPAQFWAEALNTAYKLKNICPTRALNGAIPFELWSGRKLGDKDFQRLKVFGCLAWYADLNKPKLGERAKKAILLGYEDDMKTYRLWDLSEQKIHLSRDVVFEETKFPFKFSPGPVNPEYKESEVIFSVTEDVPNSEVTMVSEGTETEIEDGDEGFKGFPETEAGEDETKQKRKSERSKKPKGCGCCNAVICSTLQDPETVEEALSRPDAEKWEEAMKMEMDKLNQSDSWKLVMRPHNKNVIGSKWIFKIKKNEQGEVERYKARLVAQGHRQIPGLDYEETYSPVVRKETVRLLMAVSVEKGWNQEHWDVTSAYLHSPIKEEVFMEQPKGFEEGLREEYVWQLQKSIYGLHQAGRDWNRFLDMHLRSYGLNQSGNDPCIYFDNKGGLVIGVYVDDLPVWGEKSKIDKLQNYLETKIEIRTLGQVSHLLSMRINRPSETTLGLDQQTYVKELLREFRMENAVGLSTPLEGKPLEEEENAIKFPEPIYRRATGSLLYLANSTRPDLSHAVSRQCQYNSKPTVSRWKEVQHILRYVKDTQHYQLTYEKQGKPIEAYVDADWGGDTNDRKSYSGFVIKLAGGAVAWSSRKQDCVAGSTVEAEYVSLSEGLKEVIWVKNVLQELGLAEFINEPFKVNVDNQGAISLANNRMTSRRSKHIDIKYHFVRDKVENGEIWLSYINSQCNPADLLTKPLSGRKTKDLSEMMGLRGQNKD